MADKKYFVLMRSGEDTGQVFASRQPRGAALKAATRGATEIRLRERGTKRVHVFKGWTEMVNKPANGPAWLPDKVKKANVKKIGIEHLWVFILVFWLSLRRITTSEYGGRPDVMGGFFLCTSRPILKYHALDDENMNWTKPLFLEQFLLVLACSS